MSLIPTKESVIGTFINPRRATNDFLQLQDSQGGTIFGWVDSDGHLQGSLLSGITGIGGSIASGQIAVGSGVNVISGSAALTFSGGSLIVNATNSISLNNSGANGTSISDSGGGGLNVLTSGGGSFNQIINTGTGGTTIEDAGGGGLTVETPTAFLTLTQGLGTTLRDTSNTGIIIDASHLGGVLSINPSGQPITIGGTIVSNIVLTGNFTETGVMTVTGPATAGTVPGNFVSTGHGPTNVLDAVLAISNSGGGATAYIGRSATGVFFITNDGAAIPNHGYFQFNSAGDVQLLAGANGAALAMNTSAGAFPAGSVVWGMPDTGVGFAVFHMSGGPNNAAWQWQTDTGLMTFAGATSGTASMGVAAVAGTPNPILLPTSTGTSGQVLTTDGANPQQTSWTGGGTGTSGTVTGTIASGTAVLGTALIASGAKATTVTVAGSGILATDNVMADFSVDPTSTTGYAPSANGMLTIIKFCTAGNVNFIVVNNTGASITPGAVTLNWRVVR
jgi:hypothetical protein